MSWTELGRRTWREVKDDVLGLAARLSYYSFLALFPAILFLLALASFFPLSNLTDEAGRSFGPFISLQVLDLIQDQMRRLASNENGGLLTFEVGGALWSSSAALVSIEGALNRAYDIADSARPMAVSVIDQRNAAIGSKTSEAALEGVSGSSGAMADEAGLAAVRGNMELVSVIIPTHNSAAFVTQAIDSVIAQTYPHIEIIVVDDGSVDNTVAVARTKLQQHCRYNWQLLERGCNGGPSITRNVGLRAARGAWVQFLDSDDLLAPTKFERQMAIAMNAPSDVAAVHSPWQRGAIRAGHAEWEGELCMPDIEGRAPIMCLVGRVRPLLGAALTRRTVLEQIRGFNESLRFWECEEISLRIAEVGRFKQVPSNEPLYLWRMPEDQDYIGRVNCKYTSTYVALGWMEQVLKATRNQRIDTIRLPKLDLRYVLDDGTAWARRLFYDDREAFNKYMIGLRTLEPAFRPTSPWHLSLVSRYMTYERAEGVAEMLRGPRRLVRRALRTLTFRK